jgi:hypothetical protein
MTEYVEVESEKTITFPTIESAGIFILMSLSLDEYRKEEYRYSYGYPQKKGKNYEVTITNFGE